MSRAAPPDASAAAAGSRRAAGSDGRSARPPAADRPEGPARRSAAQAGFTLLEVLVALAVTTAVLAAIGLVVGGNARATRALEQRAALIETARAVEAGIPPRDMLDQLEDGRLDGTVAGHTWRVDVQPLDAGEIPAGARWAPRHVRIRVRGPGGGLVELETIRLVPTGTADDEGGDDADKSQGDAGRRGAGGTP